MKNFVYTIHYLIIYLMKQKHYCVFLRDQVYDFFICRGKLQFQGYMWV